jgi:SAM-dependent methyltransferase
MSADTVPGGNDVSGGENRGVRERREPAESRLQPRLAAPQDVLHRELAYHEKLYSGFAQAHFARPAVRALRAHMAQRILRMTGAGANSRVLSLGCGIGDTELLLAPHVREIVGADLSPAAIRQARADAERLGIRNARFEVGSEAPGRYDAAIAIFFLHHLADAALAELPGKIRACLEPGGVFYSLDPSRDRLSGVVGRRLIPGLMKKYQTADEREMEAAATAGLFRRAGFEVRTEVYDFGSSPLAGLLPGWRFGYRVARALDDVLLRSAALRRRGSNFELVATHGGRVV